MNDLLTKDADRVVEYDGQYVDMGRDGARPRQMLTGVLAVLAVLAILGGVCIIWIGKQLTPSGPIGDKVGTIEIPQNATIGDVAQLLEDKGVIVNASVFSWYIELRGTSAPKAGEYVGFQANSSASEALKVLEKGPLQKNESVLTIIPGNWLSDVLVSITKTFPALTEEKLKAALTDGSVKSKYMPSDKKSVLANWEGFIYPDTYRFDKKISEVKILQALINAQEKKLDSYGYGQAESSTGHTAYELITMASLIERETGNAVEERGKIARVIYNRLAMPEKLFIDASNLYGLGKKKGVLTQSELETDNPYNLRKHAGLPPTAISLPGPYTLKAAIAPTEGPWVYYVIETDTPPTHFFTDNIDEFNAAKARAPSKGPHLSSVADLCEHARLSPGVTVAAVVGDPVLHSRSPQIHNAAFESCGLNWRFVAVHLDATDPVTPAELMRICELGGMSVTMPHKERAMIGLDEASVLAQTLCAANCLVRNGSRIVGHNTDGLGAILALRRCHGVDVAGRAVMVLGAGGAARAVIAAVDEAGASEVVIVNRSPERAQIAVECAPRSGRVGVSSDLAECEIVINATSVGMTGIPGCPIKPELLGSDHMVMDAVYQPQMTELLNLAVARGCRVVPGLAMLVGQAAYAFELWTGVDAPFDVMAKAAGLNLQS